MHALGKKLVIRKRIISANRPSNIHKDALKYYKAGHNNGQELSFIVTDGDIIDVEEGTRFHWWTENHPENKKYEQ
jgi:hypothetical protein